MKKSELKKLAGTVIKLRPAVRRLADDGRLLPSIDDDWRLWDSHDPKVVVEAVNVSTHHVLPLTVDNVAEFRHPNVIVLKEQITVHRRGMDRDPLPDPRARYVPPDQRAR